MAVDWRSATTRWRRPSARVAWASGLIIAWLTMPAVAGELRLTATEATTASGLTHTPDSATIQPLFHIERNKDANLVQYDARLTPAGRLDPADPIDAYWVKIEKGGIRKELDWMERRLAYGFTPRFVQPDRLQLEMAADIGREITVRSIDSGYRAEMQIDGRPAVIERVYVEAVETALLPKVVFIDLFGIDVETGEPVVERLRP